MARKLAGEMAASGAAKRRRELSGDEAHAWDTAPTIAVLQRVVHVPQRVHPLLDAQDEVAIEWETLSLPHDLDTIRVRGTRREAERNGWPIRELLARRLHRALRNAMVAAKICSGQAANERAKRCAVVVADSEGLFERGVQRETA